MIEGLPVSMAPAPMRIHQSMAAELLFALRNTIDEENFPECEVLYGVDWKVSDETLLRPDIVLACEDEHEAYLSKVPKMIIEILSPSTAKKDETISLISMKVKGCNIISSSILTTSKQKSILKERRYVKVGDYTHEVLDFDDISCAMTLDFAQVFKKFRK